MRKTLGSAAFAAILAACLCGCRVQPRPANQPYNGPTEPMAKVVAAINANNEAIPTLWARNYVEATIIDERKRSHFVNGSGTLLLRKPREMRFVVSKDPVGTVFEVGSVEDRFWLTIVPEEDTQWWGYWRNLGKPCAQEIPIRPDAILEVLGVGNIDTDFTHEPVPTMRFNNDADVYMFVWNARLLKRWYAQKEIWYERATLRPVKVLLFDEDGRVILRANLSKHVRIPIEGQPEDRWPVLATDFRLLFPQNQSTMMIQLSDVALQRNGRPKAGTIRFPEEPGVTRRIQIDENCDQ